jgi:hypothetical protein
MTLAKVPTTPMFHVENPPTGGLEEVKQWALQMMTRLAELQEQPRIHGIMFGRLEPSTPIDPAISKPGDGMFMWAAAGVVAAGKPEGLYFYSSGAWMRVQLVAP